MVFEAGLRDREINSKTQRHVIHRTRTAIILRMEGTDLHENDKPGTEGKLVCMEQRVHSAEGEPSISQTRNTGDAKSSEPTGGPRNSKVTCGGMRGGKRYLSQSEASEKASCQRKVAVTGARRGKRAGKEQKHRLEDVLSV